MEKGFIVWFVYFSSSKQTDHVSDSLNQKRDLGHFIRYRHIEFGLSGEIIPIASALSQESRMARNSDTIVALATAPGRAAIAVLRVSGARTRDIIAQLCASVPNPRESALRTLRNAHGDVLDQALVIYFVAPASFTGEDVVEFHLHGGQAVINAVLRAILDTGLCRLADAGEFSRRAFLNGKLDLTAAEGIADLIDAETEAQRRQAIRQLEGVLAAAVEDWRHQLIGAMAFIEASLDFADEGDVPDGLMTDGAAAAKAVHAQIDAALSDSRSGERIRDGYSVAIVGPPNAGKSTLVNRIAGRDVAIVSPIAGTTRDVIEVRCDLDGLPVVFVDTAGLRDTDDPIEREGVARARARAAAADLILELYAVDMASTSERQKTLFYPNDVDIIRVFTKADLPHSDADWAHLTDSGDITVSALNGDGIDRLLATVKQRIALRTSQDAVITRERHRRALIDASLHLQRVEDGITRDSAPELIAEDMRLALRSLGRITGRVDVEDILDRLFSGFCIGK